MQLYVRETDTVFYAYVLYKLLFFVINEAYIALRFRIRILHYIIDLCYFHVLSNRFIYFYSIFFFNVITKSVTLLPAFRIEAEVQE